MLQGPREPGRQQPGGSGFLRPADSLTIVAIMVELCLFNCEAGAPFSHRMGYPFRHREEQRHELSRLWQCADPDGRRWYYG